MAELDIIRYGHRFLFPPRRIRRQDAMPLPACGPPITAFSREGSLPLSARAALPRATRPLSGVRVIDTAIWALRWILSTGRQSPATGASMQSAAARFAPESEWRDRHHIILYHDRLLVVLPPHAWLFNVTKCFIVMSWYARWWVMAFFSLFAARR